MDGLQIARRTLLGWAGASVLCASAQGSAPAQVQIAAPTGHIVLLGDSILDNGAYVAGGPDVVRQVRELIAGGWRASNLARDGAVIAGVRGQLRGLPADASHIVVSAGGNDALGEAALLERPASSVAEALEIVGQVRARFRSAYARMLDDVSMPGLPVIVCTIYEPRFPDPARRRIAATALTALNDAITREAFARGIGCIDLRVLCDDDGDFANAIEPSVQGGAKIARAILQAVSGRGDARVVARAAG